MSISQQISKAVCWMIGGKKKVKHKGWVKKAKLAKAVPYTGPTALMIRVKEWGEVIAYDNKSHGVKYKSKGGIT